MILYCGDKSYPDKSCRTTALHGTFAPQFDAGWTALDGGWLLPVCCKYGDKSRFLPSSSGGRCQQPGKPGGSRGTEAH